MHAFVTGQADRNLILLGGAIVGNGEFKGAILPGHAAPATGNIHQRAVQTLGILIILKPADEGVLRQSGGWWGRR